MKRVVRAVFAAAEVAVGCGSAVGFGLSAHAATQHELAAAGVPFARVLLRQ